MLLFGLYGGVLVDRLPKRRTLLFTQSAMGVTGLALAVLTLTGHVQVWHVYLAAFAVGLATVVDNPARQSFVSEMVGPDQLQNAVSLNSANFQSARLIGPAVAGVHDHRRRHRLGVPLQRPVLRRPPRRPAADARA